MNSKIMAMAILMAFGTAQAQESVYDYQGQVMTGGGVSETYTADLTFFGPLSNQNTLMNMQVSFSGSLLNQNYAIDGATIGSVGASNSEPVELALNTSGVKLTSADIILTNYAGTTTAVSIGAHGDSLNVTGFSGNKVLSVENDVAGTWTDPLPAILHQAPEMGASGVAPALTFLGVCLLIYVSKRKR